LDGSGEVMVGVEPPQRDVRADVVEPAADGHEPGVRRRRTGGMRQRGRRFTGVALVLATAVTAGTVVLVLDRTDDEVVADTRPPTRLRAPLAIDDFDRPDGSVLGTSDSGQAWNLVAGEWGIDEGGATVATGAPAANVATLDLTSGNHQASVRVNRVVNGAGLVFRFKGPRNFWAAQVATGAGTWNLVRVSDGEATTVENLGLQPIADGTVIGVKARGDRIEVTVDGTAAAVVRDDSHLDAIGVGLLVPSGEPATAVRFDDFDAATLPTG
jgi:hypothetical protein